MPLYWVAYIIAIIVGEKSLLKNVIVYITGVWGFFPKYNNFSMAEWYLGAYIIFIILASAIYKYVNTLGSACIFFFIAILFSAIFSNSITVFCRNVVEDYNIYAYIWNISFWAQISVMALGVVFYHVYKQTVNIKLVESVTPRERMIVSFFILFLSSIFVVGKVFGNSYIWRMNDYLQYAIGFIGIAFSQCIFPLKFVTNKFFCFLGKNSYSIYLFHISFIKLLRMYVFEDIYDYRNIMLTFFVSIAISIITANICFLIIKPIKGMKKNKRI